MATAAGGAQPAESSRWQAGRYVLALGAVFYGAVDLILRPVAGWRQVVPLNHAPAASVLALFLIVAAVELAAGLALLAPSRAQGALRAGALALTAVYIVITLLTLPDVVLSPLVFNSWGNLGEQLSRLAGAALVLALLPAEPDPARGSGRPGLARAAYWAFAASVVTMMFEQWVYFSPTVALVPKWIPPGQVFWAVATTVAFGLAAAALLARRWALPAAGLLTAMLLGFGLLVWLPILIAHPHTVSNWTEAAETLSIAGAAWVVTDWLAARPFAPPTPPAAR